MVLKTDEEKLIVMNENLRD